MNQRIPPRTRKRTNQNPFKPTHTTHRFRRRKANEGKCEKLISFPNPQPCVHNNFLDFLPCEKMPRNGEVVEENVPTVSSSTTTRIRNRPDPFLVACRCFSVVTCLAAILCIAVNVFSAVRSFQHRSDIFDGIFRCYAVLIACFVVLAETEWSLIIKFWQVLEYWAARGMLQIFVAVMTRAFPDYTGERKELVLLQGIASYFLLACGVVYVVSGILCIGFLKRFRQKQEITREQAAKDLEELEQRREELEQLLLAERV